MRSKIENPRTSQERSSPISPLINQLNRNWLSIEASSQTNLYLLQTWEMGAGRISSERPEWCERYFDIRDFKGDIAYLVTRCSIDNDVDQNIQIRHRYANLITGCTISNQKIFDISSQINRCIFEKNWRISPVLVFENTRYHIYSKITHHGWVQNKSLLLVYFVAKSSF